MSALRPHRIKAGDWVEPGRVIVLADTSHPEVDPLTPVDDADVLLIVWIEALLAAPSPDTTRGGGA